MILFSFPSHQNLARELQKIAAVRAGQFVVGRYENQELHARIEESVSGEHCLILGTIAPPDDFLLSVTLLAETLKKEGAAKITALLPYLAYTRQDKNKQGESLGTAWVGALLRSSGIDRVITLDVHSERDTDLFPIPLISLPTDVLFAQTIRDYGLQDATIVAPDEGAISRCEAVKKAAGIATGETPYFEKKRTDLGVVHRGPVGTVGTKVLMIDDMLDTGGTLVSACEKLRVAGAREIFVLVTHGLFTGTKWMRLWDLGVKRIFCTATVPIRSDIETANITVLSITTLVRAALMTYAVVKTDAVRGT
jgi:ribose-phosphate pyrophosphokinase